MVDRNNLNRIKGILSARQGAEVPKFTQGGTTYKVNAGDTLSQIVANYNSTNKTNLKWQDVAAWNNITDPNKIQAGQIINFTNPNPAAAIPGANTNEGNPNAAVEGAAAANQQVAAIVNQAGAEAAAARVTEELPGVSASASAALQGKAVVSNTTDPISAGLNRLREEQKAAYEANLQKKEAIGNVAAVGSAAFNAVGQAVAGKQAATDSNLTKGVDAGYNAVAGVVENMGPVGKIVGTAMKTAKVAGDIIQEMGGGTDQQTTADKWMDSAFFSWNIGMLNGFAGKNSDSFGADMDTLAAVGSSYGGTASDIQDAAAKAGKKYGLFSSKARKKANEAIAKARSQQNLMGSIADDATDQRLAVQSMGEQAGLAYSMMTSGGYDQKYTYAAKHGGMLEWNPVETLEWEPQVELNWELPKFKEGGNVELIEELEWIPEFKDGGKTSHAEVPEIEETVQKNVIPEGALHKNKHHMEHAEGLTKKGIPVIDDDGEQQAEIEHSEIIFTLEVTKKLEEYYEIFYSDESSNKDKEQAALEAGRLLVYQILENTEDRTGLIDSCKKGGSLTLKKSTDDLIEEALEWMPTIVVIEEEITKEPEEKVDKKHSKEELKKSEKEQMKEAIREVLIELLTK